MFFFRSFTENFSCINIFVVSLQPNYETER